MRERRMYHLATNDNYYNGMRFTNMAICLVKAKQILAKNPGATVDIMRHEDGKLTRVVWTSDSAEQNVVLLRH